MLFASLVAVGAGPAGALSTEGTDTASHSLAGADDGLLDDTLSTTNETLENTTDTLTGELENSTETVATTVNETTDSVTGLVDGTTDELGSTLDGSADDGPGGGLLTGQTDADDGLFASQSRLDSPADRLVAALAGNRDDGTGLLGDTGGLTAGPVGSTGTLASGDSAGDTAGRAERSAESAASLSDAGGDAGPAGGETPLPDVPPEGVAGGGVALGAVAIGVLVRQGVLTSGSASGPAVGAAIEPVTRAGSDTLDRLVRLVAPLRYSRFDDSDPLEHEVRGRMFDVVKGSPGAYLSEVSEQAGVPLSTARHHVRVLEREGLVASAKVRGRRRFYPGAGDDIELAAALNDEPTAGLLDALAHHGPASVSALAEELDRDPSTISHHLTRLESDGIVIRERDGRAIRNQLAPEVAGALDPDVEPEVGPEAVASAD